MKIVISTVGDTDPIRAFHDGSLLHIVRKYRPNKVIILHSERTVERNDRITQAIQSISEDYHPEIFPHPSVFPNSEVFLFDVMYDQIWKILQEYLNTGDEFILNLSSGTPQMKAALFILNRLNDINVKAVQVVNPVNASNEGLGHDNEEDIAELIETNEDNNPDFVDRTVEDQSEKFKQSILKRTARTLIENHDYKAALEVIQQLAATTQLKRVREELSNLVTALNIQDIPKRLAKRKLGETEKKVLNAYLTIDLQVKRGNVMECFIRTKSLAEFMLEDYIQRHYPQELQDIEEDELKYLSIWDFRKILKKRQEWQLLKQIKPILDLNESRNAVAHSLNPLKEEDVKLLGAAQKSLKDLIQDWYSFDRKLFAFYDEMNKKLLEDLS